MGGENGEKKGEKEEKKAKETRRGGEGRRTRAHLGDASH